jgi:hypothetical protein
MGIILANATAEEASEYVGFGNITNGADDYPGGPSTYTVTNTNDSGAGSFRDAVSQDGRVIEFSIGGTVTLTGSLQIRTSFLTIDGSTAPSPGFTINTNGERLAIEPLAGESSGDIIMNNIRAVGTGTDAEGKDLFELDGSNAGSSLSRVIIDHCTMDSGNDSCVDIYGNVSYVTVSNCFFLDTEAVHHFSQSAGARDAITIYRNVYAGSSERQPRIRYNTTRLDYVNNVIHGWEQIIPGGNGMNIAVGGSQYNPSANIENNIYHYTGSGDANDALLIEGALDGSWYFNGNSWPEGETQGDSVSNSSQITIPAQHQVSKFATTELSALVSTNGTHFPTAAETTLLNTVATDIIPPTPPEGDIFVDLTLGGSTSTYNPTTRLSTGGGENGYNTFASAIAAATSGDTIQVRGDTHPTSWTITKDNVVIRGYLTERPTIDDSSGGPAITMDNRTAVTLRQIDSTNASGLGHVYDCTQLVFDDCNFEGGRGTGTSAGMKFARTTYSKFQNCTFDNVTSTPGQANGGDVCVLQDASDFNLFTGCTFSSGGHSLLSIRCSESNVIRNCTFDSESRQKCVEVYDCEGTSDAPIRYDSTKRNLFEFNTFKNSLESGSANDYNAIQLCGQRGIYRYNTIYDCLGGGFNLQYYSNEALENYENRIYNNTFVDNECYALSNNNRTANATYYDHKMINNLLVNNTTCAGAPGQKDLTNGTSDDRSNSEWTSDPGFTDYAGDDFTLTANSTENANGDWVTDVNGAVTVSTTFVVDDPYFFYDGYGIEGEVGDTIRFEGTSTTRIITDVNDATSTITVDAAVTLTDGQGVHIDYDGDAPSVGRSENIPVQASTSWVGIPDPADTLGYDPIAVTEPADPGNWPSAEAVGYYYIDSGHGSATDTANTYGYPDQPRLTIPTSLTVSGGSKVVVVGDGETYTGGNIEVTSSGASSAAGDQAWFIGRSATDITTTTNRPKLLNRRISASGNYVILSDIWVNEQDDNNSPISISGGAYNTVRNFTLQGHGTEAPSSGSCCSVGSNNVAYNGVIYDQGLWATNNNADLHGIKIAGTPSNVWVLEVLGYHIQGDTVQVGDASSGNPTNIYLGGVSGYENKENTIDTKICTDVIISGGEGYDLDNNWGDDQSVDLVIHDTSNWVWVIGRKSYRNARGVVVSGNGTNVFVINSVFYDMTAGGGQGLFDPGTGISAQAGSVDVVNCTFYNCRHGTEYTDGANAAGSEHKNNIYYSRNETGHGVEHFDLAQDYTSGGGEAWSDLDSDYNMYETASARCRNDGPFQEPLSSWPAGTDANSTENNPLFTNAGNDDYSLQATSPALAAGSPTKPACFAQFNTRYGFSIEFDIDGNARPATAADWDLGAYQR